MAREAKVIITSENKAQAGIKSAVKDVLGFEDAAKKVGNAITSAFSVVAIAAFTKEVARFGFESVKAFGEVERNMVKLRVALGGNEQAFSRMNTFIGEMEKKSLDLGGSVEALVGELAALGHSEADIQRITEASVALANITGGGLDAAFTKINATFTGTAGKLEKLIPELGTLTEEQLRAGDAVDILNTKFGAISNAMSEGVTQKLKTLSDNYGELRENIGEDLQGLFRPMISGINSVIEGWNKAYAARKRAATADDEELARLIINEEKARAAYAKAEKLLATAKAEATKNRASSEESAWYTRMLNEADAAYQLAMRIYSQAGAARQGYENKLTPSSPDVAPVNPGILGAGSSPAAAETDSTGRPTNLLRQAPLTIPGAPAESAPGGPLNLLGDMSFGSLLGDALAPLAESFMGMLTALGPIQEILDPIGVILASMFEVLGPLISEALAPLLGVLKIFGKILAATLIPVLNVLTPVIKLVANVMLWFANKVMIPVANFIINIWNGIARTLNAALGWAGVKIKYADKVSAVGMDDATAAGTTTDSGGTPGASYTGSQPITFNFYNNGNVVGSGGLEELAALLFGIIQRDARYA